LNHELNTIDYDSQKQQRTSRPVNKHTKWRGLKVKHNYIDVVLELGLCVQYLDQKLHEIYFYVVNVIVLL